MSVGRLSSFHISIWYIHTYIGSKSIYIHIYIGCPAKGKAKAKITESCVKNIFYLQFLLAVSGYGCPVSFFALPTEFLPCCLLFFCTHTTYKINKNLLLLSFLSFP